MGRMCGIWLRMRNFMSCCLKLRVLVLWPEEGEERKIISICRVGGCGGVKDPLSDAEPLLRGRIIIIHDFV